MYEKAKMSPVERILIIDTATMVCSVAAADTTGRQSSLVLARNQTHARHVMTMADQVLAQLDWKYNDLTHLAVSCGPGSFTGLRIGISSAKGIALALNLPILALSALELLAYQAGGWPGSIVPMIDARRKVIYFAVYRWKNGRLTVLTPPAVGAPENAIDHINEPVLLLGSGALAYQAMLHRKLGDNARFPARVWSIPHALTAAMAIINGEWLLEPVMPEKVAPIYLRKSDAEINLLRKKSNIV